MKKIMYQGAPGSYSHTTGVWYFGAEQKFIGAHHFKDIFVQLKNGEVDFGIVPIENTLAGSVYENYDLLYQYDVEIIAEHKLQIHHNLLVLPGTKFNQLKKIYSHPKALEQCDVFFENNPQIEEVVAYDTAGAAEMVAKSKDEARGAIASKDAAKLYNLDILKKEIEDDRDNWTRFFVIGKKSKSPTIDGADKASLIFSTSHKPGSLFHALKTFADHRINLTKLESRPLPDRPFEYFFYVDFEFDPQHISLVKETLKELKREARYLKVLGYYKKDTNGRGTK